MDTDMELSPSYLNPEDLSSRERFRRYGKMQSRSGQHDGSSSRFSNAALFLENVKLEVESLGVDMGGIPFDFASEVSDDAGKSCLIERESIKICKQEQHDQTDDAETTFSLFASLLDSGLQGLMPISDLILRFESCCRDVSESIRYGASGRYGVVKDRIMRQKAGLLLDEAASWSLLWYLYGKGNDELPEELMMVPTTSHLEACQFVALDHTAQLCLRIVQWLEGLASKALDLDSKIRGSQVGTCLSSSGVWHHTQRQLKSGMSNVKIVQHLDFDAPTREHAQQNSDDRKLDESFMEDLWTLVRAGRLEEACNLCRAAGQPWRVPTICPFGEFNLLPSLEALQKNGKNRMLQAIELESGIGHQWLLWKWASYCASEKIADQEGGKFEAAVYAAQCGNLKRLLPVCTDWESACWALAKSWFSAQVDAHVSRLRPGGSDQLKNFDEALMESPVEEDHTGSQLNGPDGWPLHIVNQQPRNLSSLLQKLHSNSTVHESVTRACKEQQRQIEMTLMSGDVPHLLDLIISWVSPSEDDESISRPHGDPQMMRFGAHLVLVLRYLLVDQMKDTFREKIMTVGDLIIQMYAMFLFTTQHEELVGIYASQLARHRCVDLFVHMMELRLNSSVHIRYKVFLSAIEYLPFSFEDDDTKGSFEEIIDRVLLRSRETNVKKYETSKDITEQHRLQSLQKAMVMQWLCFTPPSTVHNTKEVTRKLILYALRHSNLLFREFALISMWRVPAMPVGAHTVLSFLAEPLNQHIEVPSVDDDDFSENMREFHDWSDYYSCDAKYRSWLKIELENAEVPPHDLSSEEKDREIRAAQEALQSALLLIQRKDNLWMIPTQDHLHESTDPVYLELHAVAVLCTPSGECMLPDATLCATLSSSLYSTVSKEVEDRKLMVNASISARDSSCIEIALRCLAVEGDGLGQHNLNDGGLLATVMAAGFKGELPHFQAGVTMEISYLDAWYSTADGSLERQATFITRGLCRRCCIPEMVLRCMQVSVSLIKAHHPPDNHYEMIELVASPESDVLHLFSQRQLQELLLFEREYSIHQMDHSATGDEGREIQ